MNLDCWFTATWLSAHSHLLLVTHRGGALGGSPSCLMHYPVPYIPSPLVPAGGGRKCPGRLLFGFFFFKVFFFLRTSNEVQPLGGFAEVSAWYCGQKHPPVWWTVLRRTGPLTPPPRLQHLAEDGRVRTERATLLGEQLRVLLLVASLGGNSPPYPHPLRDLHLQTSVIDIFSRDA